NHVHNTYPSSNSLPPSSILALGIVVTPPVTSQDDPRLLSPPSSMARCLFSLARTHPLEATQVNHSWLSKSSAAGRSRTSRTQIYRCHPTLVFLLPSPFSRLALDALAFLILVIRPSLQRVSLGLCRRCAGRHHDDDRRGPSPDLGPSSTTTAMRKPPTHIPIAHTCQIRHTRGPFELESEPAPAELGHSSLAQLSHQAGCLLPPQTHARRSLSNTLATSRTRGDQPLPHRPQPGPRRPSFFLLRFAFCILHPDPPSRRRTRPLAGSRPPPSLLFRSSGDPPIGCRWARTVHGDPTPLTACDRCTACGDARQARSRGDAAVSPSRVLSLQSLHLHAGQRSRDDTTAVHNALMHTMTPLHPTSAVLDSSAGGGGGDW
ncbi:hypothetical protein BD310DRAFT_997311, partial [Dichomitus squalens]